MKVSLEHIRYYKDQYKWSDDPAPKGIDELAQKIGAQLAAVEDVVDFGKRFEGIIVVKVVSCADHPNAERLHVCMVDDGGKVQGVARDDRGFVQIVCGANNVREGMLAAWLPPGSTVPNTLDKEPFVLEARELRGVASNGMLASQRELGLGDDHDGILDVDEDAGPIAPGTAFIDAFGLRDDYVIDMENKMFTHRPDLFGMLGIAREIAGIQQQKFTSPDWYRTDASLDTPDGPLEVEVKNELPDLVPRFVVVPMSDVTVKPSPVWVQINLLQLGIRPINNIVDLTNYYMMLTGQPLHAYDYDKVKARSDGDKATIVVRYPKQGEKIKLLNGKEIEPRKDAIMIATNKESIGIGGVMGGSDTEVDESTKNIIFECANFDMYSIRRTSMAHGLFTDAVTRFNKGQSPLQNVAVIAKIAASAEERAGAKLAGKLVDDNHVAQDIQQRDSIHPPVTVTTGFINERLGWSLSADEMSKLLTNVEFKVEASGDELTVTAPFWRTDIEIPEDVVEEVGRLNGYDKLPLDLPKRDLTPADPNPLLDLKNDIRTKLAAAGANEVLTYSFVHGNLLDKVGQNRDQAFQLSNALSPDLQYFRLTLTPSLLERVHPNIKAGYDQFALFELGMLHNKTKQDDEGLPRELNSLSLVFAASDRDKGLTGAPYYYAKQYLMSLGDLLGLQYDLRFESLDGADLGKEAWVEQLVAPYEPGRSAVLRDKDGIIWGVVGEYRAAVRKALKLPDFVAGFEIGPFVFRFASTKKPYSQLSKFPSVEQDICLKVPAATPYDTVFQFVRQQTTEQGIKDTRVDIEPVDIYQRPDEVDRKQITLRLSVTSQDRTLTDEEVSKLLDRIAEAAKDQLKAERI